MQIQLIGTTAAEDTQIDLDAVPRVGDFVTLKEGESYRVERVEWDLSDRDDVQPLGARIVRVHCAA